MARVAPCAHCGKPKKPPAKFLVDPRVYERDGFCSAACAKAAHGVREREGRKL